MVYKNKKTELTVNVTSWQDKIRKREAEDEIAEKAGLSGASAAWALGWALGWAPLSTTGHHWAPPLGAPREEAPGRTAFASKR